MERTITPPVASTSDSMNVRDERRAALLLHALAADDQAWVLGALPTREQERLSEMLTELQYLGIEPDLQIFESAFLQEGNHAAPDDDMQTLHRLNPHQVQALIELLSKEPIALIVQILRVAEWPWARAVLEALDAERSREVRRELAEHRDTQLPDGIRQSLRRALWQRLSSLSHEFAPFQSKNSTRLRFTEKIKGLWLRKEARR